MSETQKHTKPNVPNLRFPGFEGEWEKQSLGEVGEPFIGLTYSPSDVVSEGGVIVFRSSNIQNGEIDYSDIVRVNKKLKESIVTRKDDLVICARNGSPRLIGKNALLKESDANQTFGAFMLVYRSPENHFIHQLLSTKRYYSQVSENLGARINQITTANIKDFEFFFPKGKDERDKISKFLDFIDQRIAIQNRVIERYESLIKALAEKLMLIDCQEVKLGEISSIYQPTTISSNMLKQDGKYSVYGANGIIGFYDEYNHATPQICIACRGSSCGAVNYSLPFSWITGNAMVINTDKYANIVNKRYLYHYLTLLDYTPLISGSGQPQIVRKPLQSLKIRLPEIGTQKSIAEALDSISKKVNIEVDIRSKYMDSKRCLLSELFI